MTCFEDYKVSVLVKQQCSHGLFSGCILFQFSWCISARAGCTEQGFIVKHPVFKQITTSRESGFPFELHFTVGTEFSADSWGMKVRRFEL